MDSSAGIDDRPLRDSVRDAVRTRAVRGHQGPGTRGVRGGPTVRGRAWVAGAWMGGAVARQCWRGRGKGSAV